MEKTNVDVKSTKSHDIKNFRSRSMEKKNVELRSKTAMTSRNLELENWSNRTWIKSKNSHEFKKLRTTKMEKRNVD
jgi:hypothetical protein